MLTLSTDPNLAERQMAAIIFSLTTFGYIDGDFDASEQEYVRKTIDRLIAHRVETALADEGPDVRQQLIEQYTQHFHDVFEVVDRQVQALFDESIASDEGQDEFIHAQLKRHCFELLESFDAEGQEALMETVDELLMADGFAHPAELKFRAELSEILEADLGIVVLEETQPEQLVSVEPIGIRPHKGKNHAFLDVLERHYSNDPIEIYNQMEEDRELADKVVGILDEMRKQGRGRLKNNKDIKSFSGEAPFLDGHVFVLPARPSHPVELTVLGDLHGCYSCLKAALLQSKFFEKVEAYKADPSGRPEPKLVLLGDYIDRGIFSYNGVIRAILQIFVTAPEHVYLLRGNHEFYVEYQGAIYGGVRPAEAIESLRPYAPEEIFQHFKGLFDALPNMLLADKLLFVHGGLPRELVLKERYRDLSSLNDPLIRFQMMWSDPSRVDVIPAKLQTQSARFPFGRLQFQAFMQRIGCHTMIRGHEKVNEGARLVYDDDPYRLLTVFSAGGKRNNDLPRKSSYRKVTPVALTVKMQGDNVNIEPWIIDYEAYNQPSRNAFFKSPPPIPHKAGADASHSLGKLK